MDPLSITAAVATLLGCCISTGVALRKFLIGATEVKTVVQAMMGDLRALRAVLETMEVTFEEMNSDKPVEGLIGAHWVDLFQSLGDSQQSIGKLQKVLEDVGKEVKFLDTARRQLRIKTAADEIAVCRQEVQTYKDALQLSLHTITWWNTHKIKGTADEVLETSRATHQDLQRLATNVELKLTALQMLFQQTDQPGNLSKVSNLFRTMNSAATVIASDSGDVADPADLGEVMSIFGDWWNNPAASQYTLDWVRSDIHPELARIPNGPNGLASPTQTVEQSVPTFSMAQDALAHGSLIMPLISDVQRSRDLTHSAMSDPRTAISRSPGSVPALLPPQTLIEGLPRPGNAESADSQATSSTTTTTGLESQLSKEGLLPEPPNNNSRRRFSWFRFNKAEKIPIVRSPMDSQNTSSMRRRTKLPATMKLVFVGDGATGKTCLIIMITKGSFPEVYVPTVFENYAADVDIDGQAFTVGFFDTAGQEDYDRLRPLSYPGTDAFVITFAIDSPDSLDQVQEKWISEVLHFHRGAPIFLIGCKKDLRHDRQTIEQLSKTSQKPVTVEQAEAVRKRIGAIAYIETSAKTGEGASLAITTIMRHVIQHKLDAATKKRSWLRS